jgi:lipoprotein-anchoring transpeptidase ErfK/SrfK
MDNGKEESTPSDNRFNNHLKSNLVHLHKNIYMNRTDPLYFEKILDFSDPKSPEAHYMLAQKYESKGNTTKALFHYKEATNDKSSLFYPKAKDRIRQMQRPVLTKPAAKLAPVLPKQAFRKTPLFILLLCNLVLILILFNLNTIRAVVSSALNGKLGMDIVYETVDTPYVIYIPNNELKENIESILYRKTAEIGKQNPKHNIQLYGIKTNDPSLQGTISPLISDTLKSSAFVIAQYNASIDQAVKIQFLSNEASRIIESKPSALTIPTLTKAASNLVRSALSAYINDNKAPPLEIERLISDYPNNYLSFIPNEILSASNRVMDHFDGSGGWVYQPQSAELSSMFYPNIIDQPTALQISYSPLKLLISKKAHSLLLTSGSVVLANKSVGTGKENRTPEGSFTIEDRVINPLGNHPNIYGQAGLSMGHYAIHGTYDSTSIAVNKSLGCIRIANEDIVALYPFVPKGTTVQIANQIPSGFQNAALMDLNPLIPSQKPSINETPIDKIFNWLG